MKRTQLISILGHTRWSTASKESVLSPSFEVTPHALEGLLFFTALSKKPYGNWACGGRIVTGPECSKTSTFWCPINSVAGGQIPTETII
jgi:hypothetical protein